MIYYVNNVQPQDNSATGLIRLVYRARENLIISEYYAALAHAAAKRTQATSLND